MSMKNTLYSLFMGTILISIFIGLSSFKHESKSIVEPYKNKQLSIAERVNDLLNRMTLDEKINLLGGTGFATKPIKRFGLPALKMSDGPLGVRWGKSTAFPAGIAMASSWDTSLVKKVGAAIGREVKSKGRDVILGPCVNIARIPMGGRNFESFGEDPYLTSRMGVNYIKGVQSEDVAATVKHFDANNQEYERMFVNVKLGARAMHEIYLPAFKAAVEEGKVMAVMSAYNKVNNHYCSENDYLLETILKDKWNFGGLVMSDWGAVHSSIPTANGGLDLEMPTGKYLNKGKLSEAINSGSVKESEIDDKVRRILTVIFKLGIFDNPRKPDESLLNTKENRETAYKSALEGIVLLKNKNSILPLNPEKVKSIAVIGPNAAVARTGGGGSSRVEPVFSVSPLTALKNKLGKKVKINYAEGILMDGDSPAIDSSLLLLPDGKTPGLKGEYFSNQNLKGNPAFTRIDKKVDFNWGDGSPKKNFNKDHFSVKWTGFISPKEDGKYTLELVSDDGVRFYLNNKLVIDDWTDHSSVTHLYSVNFKSNKKYKIRLEYYENGGGANVKLSMRTNSKKLISDAVLAASKSDVALLFVGTSDQFESEGFDRKDLILPNNQDELIKKITQVNKNVVVVLTTGSPVLMNDWIENVDGLIETWFDGEEIGNAAADVLLGNYNPSGKLPITFPKSWKDCSAFTSYKNKDSVSVYSDGIYVGYRYFDKHNIEPLFPFGYGLSYTKFQYSDMNVENNIQNDNTVSVSFRIKNVGEKNGAEISQIYLSAVNPKVEMAPKELKGFSRTFVNAGKTKLVTIKLQKSDFAYYDEKQDKWIVNPGKYIISVGSSSRDIRFKKEITL